VDRELAAGTAAHYEDPAYYTKTYKNRLEDVRFYVDLARARGGPVLEYGCGNGRITIPIARHAIEVTGVDLSAPMLADLEQRLRGETEEIRSHVRIVRGDMRKKRLGRRFPLIVSPFNALLHLYTRKDVEQFLARAREHLAPGGELVFDVSMPEAEEQSRDPARAYRTPGFVYPEVGPVRYAERFDYDRLRQILFVSMEFTPSRGGEPWMTPLCHRQFYPQELEALLHYNGWRIARASGDFVGGKLTRESAVIVLFCKPRR
jgi:SAM-dependent methyltransferase